MKTFKCVCGARVFFANSCCVGCQRDLVFVPDQQTMATVMADDPALRLAQVKGAYRRCQNQLDFGVCNWVLKESESDSEGLCQACRLNDVIPDLSFEANKPMWAEVELAKRHLLYTTNQLGLPALPKTKVPWGLSFQFMKDGPGREVLTGHDNGLITLNMREADPVAREQARVDLREGYRTLLGHMRHEVGHYYWDLLIADSPLLDSYRGLFGDERADYAEALEKHYSGPPEPGWEESFISVYAGSHPWEDWAETWAHLLHMVDTLETANHFGLQARNSLSRDRWKLDEAVAEWGEVTVALNALNRSMGMPDPYPFAITPRIHEKLAFVADAVRNYEAPPLPAV